MEILPLSDKLAGGITLIVFENDSGSLPPGLAKKVLKFFTVEIVFYLGGDPE